MVPLRIEGIGGRWKTQDDRCEVVAHLYLFGRPTEGRIETVDSEIYVCFGVLT